MNQPLPPDLTVADLAKELERITAEQEYLSLLYAKAQGLPIWFH